MKREIKDKKKILNSAPEKKNSVAKAEVEKKIAASGKLIKQPGKTASSKTKKQPALALNLKNNLQNKPQTNKASAKQNGKSGANLKTAAANQKSVKSVLREKSTARAASKNPKTNQKFAAANSKAKSAAVKTEKSKIEKTAPVLKSKPGAKVVSPKVEKKMTPRAKGEKTKIKTVVSVQKIKPQLKAEKTKIAAAVRSVKPEVKKSKAVSAGKAESKLKPKISAKEIKLPKLKIKLKQTIEKAVEAGNIIESAPKKKIVNKKVKPIGSAVFRGKKAKYDFQVFALDEKFEQIKAVYIISKRKTDRKKRGHHKLVCIDQTESIVDGIKKHKKEKCIKHNQANVVCLLKEENEKNRLRITADLREAHTVVCNQK